MASCYIETDNGVGTGSRTGGPTIRVIRAWGDTDQGSPPKSAGAMDEIQSARSPSSEVIVYPPEVVNRQIQHKLKSASRAGSELESLDSPTVITTRRGRVVSRPSRYQDSAV